MMLSSVIMLMTVVLMYQINSNMGDYQYMYIDLLLVIGLNYTMSKTKAQSKIGAEVPNSSLFNHDIVLSIVGQSLIQIGFQVAGIR